MTERLGKVSKTWVRGGGTLCGRGNEVGPEVGQRLGALLVLGSVLEHQGQRPAPLERGPVALPPTGTLLRHLLLVERGAGLLGRRGEHLGEGGGVDGAIEPEIEEGSVGAGEDALAGGVVDMHPPDGEQPQ